MEDQEHIKELLKQGIIPVVEAVEKNKNKNNKSETNVEVIRSPHYEPHKIKIKEFIESNRNKYSVMKNFLMNRPELQNAVSIKRANQINEKKTTIIAMIYDIAKMQTGTLRLELEDPSGKMLGIISKKNEELIKKAEFLARDEVVGLIGGCGKNVFFINDIVWPDIPQKQVETTDEDVYVAFLADTHVGSNVFLEKEFENFIDWLRGEHIDDEQKKIAEKVKYVLFAGDVVDGVGVYPQQDRELKIVDIYDQYKVFTNYLKKIPKNKQIVICPGTHEGVRIEDPKPKIPKELAPDLHEMENVHLITDPAEIRLHRNDNYKGINILMYHGDSFDYYINSIDTLRSAGGYDKGTEVHKFLLQRRNLSPCYSGQEVLPMKENPLILYQIPDVLHTGHIHKSDVGVYKGVILICSSCFQGRTSFQEKLGHHPDPGKVILMNLRNLKLRILDFTEAKS